MRGAWMAITSPSGTDIWGHVTLDKAAVDGGVRKRIAIPGDEGRELDPISRAPSAAGTRRSRAPMCPSKGEEIVGEGAAKPAEASPTRDKGPRNSVGDNMRNLLALEDTNPREGARKQRRRSKEERVPEEQRAVCCASGRGSAAG